MLENIPRTDKILSTFLAATCNLHVTVVLPCRMCFCALLLSVSSKTSILSIHGTCLGDCLISAFCEPCSLNQMAREVNKDQEDKATAKVSKDSRRSTFDFDGGMQMRLYGYPLPARGAKISYDFYWDRGTKASKFAGPCFCCLGMQD
ncbi:hypothetical protein CYMTET_4358 [Cymbomonas tetramitiformis]|uniref:Uncharacterized protein n=1 Tax=Cymbomonas tetramitiformis TaxID=36881 RepID=A0AAE0H334_9CHLO|nr:hypothetical protein CYMTET_4358 [Cymbomonas tetramitiformis]